MNGWIQWSTAVYFRKRNLQRLKNASKLCLTNQIILKSNVICVPILRTSKLSPVTNDQEVQQRAASVATPETLHGKSLHLFQ